jgi:protein-S-isoprenylcysteine O-methyltransferase Ste14
MTAPWIADPDIESAAQLYLPLTVAVIGRLVRGPRPRQFAACLLSVMWTLPALIVLQLFNLRAGWWTYSYTPFQFHGMPFESLIGWAVLWGLLPQLLFPRLGLLWVAAIMATADLIYMPLCSGVVQLGPHWLVGEAVALLVVLAPSLCIARWTYENTHPRARSTIQVVTAAMLFLLLIPDIIFTFYKADGWAPLLHGAGWQLQIWIQLLLLVAVPGISAVMEFAERGRGTPIPYDPPPRLVTSGMYRFCANPMQLSSALVMLLWAVILRSKWIVAAAVMSAIYSAGVARWDESQDLSERFGAAWQRYRQTVHDWRIRWLPYHAGPDAMVFIAATCGSCSELRRWILARAPIGLQIVDAETLPAHSIITRMRYDPGDGSAPLEGVRAMARVLEHLNFGWAFAGAILRLPLVWQAVQLCMDASGLGPRNLPPAVSQGLDKQS